MSMASALVMEAVEPKISSSNPARSAPLTRRVAESTTIPAPNDALETVATAVSALSRVCRVIHSMETTAQVPARAAPSMSSGMLRSC